MLLNIYVLILILTVIVLGISCHKARKNGTALAKKISIMHICAIAAILSDILFVAPRNIFLSYIGFSLFSAMIDWILVAMFYFVAEYVSYENINSTAIKGGIILCVLDSISLMLNVFFKHVYVLNQISFLSKHLTYEASGFTYFYYAHLVLCYIIVIRIAMLLINRAYRSSAFYRNKYIVIIVLFAILLVLDALCVILHVPLNASILLYGGLSLSISYYSLYYQPSKLLNDILRMVMKNINNGIVVFDDRQKCIYANDVVWDMFNLEKDIHILENFACEGQYSKASIDEPYTVWEEERIINGRQIYFELQRQNIYDKRNIFVGSYFNIIDETERHIQHEKEINAEKEANRNKSDFLSRVSHDIRTPLNSISGMNEMILRESKDAAISEYAGYIKESVEVLTSLVNDVLDYSKIEAGKMTLVERDYNVGELWDSIIHIVKLQAEKKGLIFKCRIDKKLPSMLRGDDIKLRQIMLNLLSNAVKYTMKGTIVFRLWGGTDDRGDFHLMCDVSDSGIGIKKEDIPKLFMEFERLDEVKNHSIQGTGLGLNITNYFLMMMGSRLEVESEYGKGSTFSFKVKQHIIDDKPLSSDAGWDKKGAEASRTSLEKPGANILVVDDNAVNRKVFINLLKETKIKIDEAESGRECLDMIKAKHYDIIYLDHMMPGMDGMETLKKMQTMKDNKCKYTPVIMLTANTMDDARDTYINAGFQDFLSKPIQLDILEQSLKRYLL